MIYRESMKKMARIFDLPPDETHGQAWESFHANPDRLEEFLEAYNRADLDERDRSTLMDLILASFADLIDRDGFADEKWKIIRDILERDLDLHRASVSVYGDSPYEHPLRSLCKEVYAGCPGED